MRGRIKGRLAIGLILVAISVAAHAKTDDTTIRLSSTLQSQNRAAGTVKDITVTGNQRQSKEGILSTMRTKVGQQFVQATLDEDRQNLYDLGVFKTEPLVVAHANTDGTFSITVEVVEFDTIKEIRVTGNTVVSKEEILSLITLKPGDAFSARAANVSAVNIRQYYSKKGFFAAVFDFGPLPESPQTLNIQILETTVESVQITGAVRTKKRVLDHLIKTRRGDPFDSHKWTKDVQRVYNSGWFEKVDPTIDEQSDPGKVKLGVGVKESRSGNFGLGLQIDPQSSFAGFLNYRDSNFQGSGQSVGASYTQGTRGGGPSVDFNYGNPFIDNHDTAMRAAIYSRVVYRFTSNAFGGSDLPTGSGQYLERRTGMSLGFSRPLSDTVSVGLSNRIEGVKTENLQVYGGQNFIVQDGDIASSTFAITRNRRDTDIDASRGDWLSMSVEPGYSDITKVGGLISRQRYLGPSGFAKFYGEYRLYLTRDPRRTIRDLEASRRVLAFRLRAGSIVGKIPFFEQYFVGGADTVRGYDEDRFWGKNELIATAEYRYPLQKAFNLVFFVDYGGAWGGYGSINSFVQSDTFQLHLGYGVGLSFRTPLGPIRVDLGFNENGGSRTHFQIGTSF